MTRRCQNVLLTAVHANQPCRSYLPGTSNPLRRNLSAFYILLRHVPGIALNSGLFSAVSSMSAASPGNASALFDLKSASLTLVAFVLKTGNIQALGQAMAERFGDTPDFFSRDPIVIDLTHLALSLIHI